MEKKINLGRGFSFFGENEVPLPSLNDPKGRKLINHGNEFQIIYLYRRG